MQLRPFFSFQRILVQAVSIFLFWCGLMGTVWSAIPQQINIQGQLTDASGAPLNGNYSFTFGIYYIRIGGSAIFSETTSSLTVNNGIFNYLLGTNTPLSLAFGTTYWLGINVNGDGEMTPRQPIVSVGDAYKAWNSDSAFAASTSTYLTSAANIIGGTLADVRLSTNVSFLVQIIPGQGHNSLTIRLQYQRF